MESGIFSLVLFDAIKCISRWLDNITGRKYFSPLLFLKMYSMMCPHFPWSCLLACLHLSSFLTKGAVLQMSKETSYCEILTLNIFSLQINYFIPLRINSINRSQGRITYVAKLKTKLYLNETFFKKFILLKTISCSWK